MGELRKLLGPGLGASGTSRPLAEAGWRGVQMGWGALSTKKPTDEATVAVAEGKAKGHATTDGVSFLGGAKELAA
jgi:hypothetical protein